MCYILCTTDSIKVQEIPRMLCCRQCGWGETAMQHQLAAGHLTAWAHSQGEGTATVLTTRRAPGDRQPQVCPPSSSLNYQLPILNLPEAPEALDRP